MRPHPIADLSIIRERSSGSASRLCAVTVRLADRRRPLTTTCLRVYYGYTDISLSSAAHWEGDRVMLTNLQALPSFFLRPLAIVRDYRLSDLRPDLIAGVTVAIISLPQAIAYAL